MFKGYRKLLVVVLAASVISAISLLGVGSSEDNDDFLLMSEMEISLLQCRKSEKNFLMRHNRASVDNFAKAVQAIRKLQADMRYKTDDKAIFAALDNINSGIEVYENAFQDIKGLYDSATFGSVHDPALSKITDEVTLMAEPTTTPSKTDTTDSLVEAARNLEYYINISTENSTSLISMLQARRWEKNFRKIYDEFKGGESVKAAFCIRRTNEEVSRLKALIGADAFKTKNKSSIKGMESALQHYEANFNQLVSNKDVGFMKRKEMTKSARLIEKNIQLIKSILTLESGHISGLMSEMEISLLQCRKSEKNFLMRHNRASVDNFAKAVQVIRKYETNLRSMTRDRVIVDLLGYITGEITNYENAFQDIKGLYDSATFGSVHDPALSKITDEVTLMAEPTTTPSKTDTTDSLVEAARNLEYYINISTENSTSLISMLQARRWEKNFQERYDRLTGAVDSQSISYLRKAQHELSGVRDWLESQDSEGKSGIAFGQLRSALKRYEVNLAQLSRNFDAFYIKRKEMLRSARDLERAIQMIKRKLFDVRVETEIGGIYYLNPKLPIHGQPQGNYHDVGSLVLNQPSGYGYRHCKNWMQFYFDRDGHYTKENTISSVYFHIWIRTVNNNIDIGYERDGKYSGGRGGMDDFIPVKYDDSKGYSVKNGCSLITGRVVMDTFIIGEDIYKFAIKLSRHAGYPSIVMEPNQYSFIIINPPCDSVLKSTDSDDDGLNDYEEMYLYYTNPHDDDTDGDGFSDRTEILKGTSSNMNDLYSGGVIKGVNDTPYIDHYKDIHGDWIVDKEERVCNSKYTLHGNLFVRDGGRLTLENCTLVMNRKAKSKHIYVAEGGTLILKNTEINFHETGYWYKIVEGGNVKEGCNLDVYGILKAEGSVLKNSLGIQVHEGSKTDIHDSNIFNCYHLSYVGESESKVTHCRISTFIGIPIYCKSSSPFVKDVALNVEYAGVGVYCSDSSPSIYDSKIFVCEDEDSDSLAVITLGNSHPVLSNTLFNAKRVRHDENSTMVFE